MECIERLEFEPCSGRWSHVLHGYMFIGVGVPGRFQFIITAEALGDLLRPSDQIIDEQLGVAVFHRFEQDILRIAEKEVHRRGNDTRPIILKHEHMV